MYVSGWTKSYALHLHLHLQWVDRKCSDLGPSVPTFSKMVSMAATKCALTRRARLSAWAWASAPRACRIFWVAASLSMNRVSA